MWICVFLEGFPSVALLISKWLPEGTQLVSFHLSLPIGSIYSSPYFCTTTKMVTYLAKYFVSNLPAVQAYPIALSAAVQDNLKTWCHLLVNLAERPTHLRELKPFPPTWIGATDALGT